MKTNARWRSEEHTHVEHFEGDTGGATGDKGYLLPFKRRSPETEDVHEGPRGDSRAGKRAQPPR